MLKMPTGIGIFNIRASLPPLGQSDHNVVHLIPRYRFLVQKAPTLTIKEWSVDTVQNLKGSLDCTELDVFVDAYSDINELNESLCGYVEFCVECTIPQKNCKNVPQLQTQDN